MLELQTYAMRISSRNDHTGCATQRDSLLPVLWISIRIASRHLVETFHCVKVYEQLLNSGKGLRN